MGDTYTQRHDHVVFAVKYRQNLISLEWKETLYKYICGIIMRNGQKPVIIGGVEDHIHLLIGLRPDYNLSDLVREIKSNSSKWKNENNLTQKKFEWQSGFGAFSVCYSHLDRVIKYIANQENHHKKITFRDEYIEMLKMNNINFKTEYLFDDIGNYPFL